MKKKYGYNRFTGTDIVSNDTMRGVVENFKITACSSAQVSKNLFDKSNFNELNANLNSETINLNNNERTIWFKCEKNTTYTFQKPVQDYYVRFSIGETIELPTYNVSVQNRLTDAYAETMTYTTSSTAEYIAFWYYCTGSELYTKQQILDALQIEYGSTATSYVSFYPTPDYPVPILSSADGGAINVSVNENITSIPTPEGYVGGSLPNGVADTDTQKKIGKLIGINGTSVTIDDMKSGGSFYSTVGGTLNDKTITFASSVTNATIIYELATPIPITLTKPQIRLYEGKNYITTTNYPKPSLEIEAWANRT